MPATTSTQTFANHSHLVPGFHIVTGTLALANLIWSLYRVIRYPGADTAFGVVVAVVLSQLFFYTRQFPLAVQDRVIRLEERLRLERLLPNDLKPRADEFTPSQLIALRFASDAELPELARRVLAEKLGDRKTIKSLVREWRPDHFRA